jgi:hypothetical protein
MEWLAHSFLAVTPLRDRLRRVVPLLGFSWGFDIADQGRITLRPVARLSAGDWDAHLPHLRKSYPGWEFGSGSTSADERRIFRE